MGTTKLEKRGLVLGGGEINDYAAVKARIRGGELVICADSGFLHCEKLGLTPDLIVGDFDSIGTPPANIEVLEYPAEKDYTDSTLAIETAVKHGCTRLLLGGMLGGRLDHSVANLQNLAWCANNGVEAEMTDGITEVCAVANGKITLAPRKDTYFSVVSMSTKCGAVTIEGAKYPLDHYPLSSDFPRAISNEFEDKNAVITVENGTAVIIITPKSQ